MLYVFIIAVLNLAIGFAMACHLGRRGRPHVPLGELPLVEENPRTSS
jgi:hypothetical protein